MAIFTGAGVALVTPFHEDGSVNYDKLDELIDYHCEHGTDSIIIWNNRRIFYFIGRRTYGVHPLRGRTYQEETSGNCRYRFQRYLYND